MTARLKKWEPVDTSTGFVPHRGLAGTHSGDSCCERVREGSSKDSMRLTAGKMEWEQEGLSRDF